MPFMNTSRIKLEKTKLNNTVQQIGQLFVLLCILILLKEDGEGFTIGPSGVCALPLGVAAERSVHYFWDYFSSFFLRHILFSQKGLC